MFLLLSTSDTDLLSARASGSAWRPANPARSAVDDLPALLDGADLVVVRILGGRRAWAEGLDALLASGLPVVVLGGEQAQERFRLARSGHASLRWRRLGSSRRTRSSTAASSVAATMPASSSAPRASTTPHGSTTRELP